METEKVKPGVNEPLASSRNGWSPKYSESNHQESHHSRNPSLSSHATNSFVLSCQLCFAWRLWHIRGISISLYTRVSWQILTLNTSEGLTPEWVAEWRKTMCHLLSLALGVNGYYYYYCTAVGCEGGKRVASANGDKRRSCGVIPGEASSSSSSSAPPQQEPQKFLWFEMRRHVLWLHRLMWHPSRIRYRVSGTVSGWLRGERQCQCEWETTDTRCLINFMQISVGGLGSRWNVILHWANYG